MNDLDHRRLLALESEVATAKKELKRFAYSDLVGRAWHARELIEQLEAVNADHATTLLAISSALLPFSQDVDGTIVDKVRALVERWQALEDENVRLRGLFECSEHWKKERT